MIRPDLSQPGDKGEIKGPDSIKISVTDDHILLIFGQAKFGGADYVKSGLKDDLKKMIKDLRIYEYYKWVVVSTDLFEEPERNEKLQSFMDDLFELSETNLNINQEAISPIFEKHKVKMIFPLVGVFESKDLYSDFNSDKIEQILQQYDDFFHHASHDFIFNIPYELEFHLLMVSDKKAIRNDDLFRF